MLSTSTFSVQTPGSVTGQVANLASRLTSAKPSPAGPVRHTFS